jgi:hypothetical protein
MKLIFVEYLWTGEVAGFVKCLFIIVSGKLVPSCFVSAMRDVGGQISVVGIATCHRLEGLKPDGARFSAPVQTLHDAHPTSSTMGAGFLSRM